MKERDFAGNEKLTEHCGLGAILNAGDLDDAAERLLAMERMMMTRGQEGYGIVGVTAEGEIIEYRELGINWRGPSEDKKLVLNGCQALFGQNRYPTRGPSGSLEDLQPFVHKEERQDGSVRCLILAHNGEFVNVDFFKRMIRRPILSERIRSDTAYFFDVIWNTEGLGNSQSELWPMENEFLWAVLHAKGAASLIMGNQEGVVYGGRDPRGFRPLFCGKIGREKKSWALASETVALEYIGAVEIQNIEPGHFWRFTLQGKEPVALFYSPEECFCAFEGVYFMQPGSRIYVRRKDGRGREPISVAATRVLAGKILAENDRGSGIWEKAVVVSINESGRYASQGYSLESGVFNLDVLCRNRDASIGRAFIESTDKDRQRMISYKYYLIEELIELAREQFGRVVEKIIEIDDSIVRGDTTRYLSDRLRRIPGIKEVHSRAASPAIICGCHLGIDTEDQELVAWQNQGDWRKIAAAIKVDSVAYLSPEELKRSLVLGRDDLSRDGFCLECFTGERFLPELIERRELAIPIR